MLVEMKVTFGDIIFFLSYHFASKVFNSNFNLLAHKIVIILVFVGRLTKNSFRVADCPYRQLKEILGSKIFTFASLGLKSIIKIQPHHTATSPIESTHECASIISSMNSYVSLLLEFFVVPILVDQDFYCLERMGLPGI